MSTAKDSDTSSGGGWFKSIRAYPQFHGEVAFQRLPRERLDLKALLKMPTGRFAGNKAIQAPIADRGETVR
jgi:hypothetical protein